MQFTSEPVVLCQLWADPLAQRSLINQLQMWPYCVTASRTLQLDSRPLNLHIFSQTHHMSTKRTVAVQVYVDPSPDAPKGVKPRQVATLKREEAKMLTVKKFAVWRGRKGKSLTLLIPVKSLFVFIGQMRFKPRPEMTALDSRTHVRLTGLKGYEHTRNEAYAADAPGRDEVFQPELIAIKRAVAVLSSNS